MPSRILRMNECGAHHGAFGNQQSSRLEVSIDHLKQYRCQFVTFQKMPEIQYRDLVRQGISSSAKSRKAAHAIDFVQGIFHLPVGQVELVLQAVDAEHAPKPPSADGPATLSWGNAVLYATAILAKVLPLPSRLRKPSGASGVSCDCSLGRQNSAGVSWRIEQLSGSAIVSISGICSAIPYANLVVAATRIENGRGGNVVNLSHSERKRGLTFC